MQWWIDTIGKVGPLCVALAVYLSNRAQTKWANQISIRAAEVEDQKFRLSLLERRQTVVEQLRSAIRRYLIEGEFDDDATANLSEALSVAEFVFADEDLAVLQDLSAKVSKLRIENRRQQRYQDNDRIKYESAVNAAAAIEDDLSGRFKPIIKQLQEATRVAIPLPLRPRFSVLEKLVQAFHRRKAG